MTEVRVATQKHLITFCRAIPVHTECWKSVLQEAAKPLQNLANLCEQRRCVQKAKLAYLDNFEDIQATLLYQISNRIEEELAILKELVISLSKSNYDLKNKLMVLERSTLKLDWDEDSELITGNATQPSLSRLLHDGLAYLTYFSKKGKNISDAFKSVTFDNEKSIEDLIEYFTVDLSDRIVTNLIAITQYVDNEKSIS